MAGFICAYYGNTGSSWLLQVLGTSPQILVPGFEPIEGWAWDAPRSERIEWLRTALSPPADHEGEAYDLWVKQLQTSPQVDDLPEKPGFLHVGLKVNNLAVVETETVSEVLAGAGAKVIVLSRDNRIKHALSLYRYHEESKSQFELKGVRPPSEVRLRKFNWWVKESRRLHGHMDSVRDTFLQRLGQDNVTTLSYEEFATPEGKQRTIDRLTDFLGIDPFVMAESQYAKATPDDLKSALVNYNTVRLRYALTPMREFFGE